MKFVSARQQDELKSLRAQRMSISILRSPLFTSFCSAGETTQLSEYTLLVCLFLEEVSPVNLPHRGVRERQRNQIDLVMVLEGCRITCGGGDGGRDHSMLHRTQWER